MFIREIKSQLLQAVSSFPAVVLTGPRQSGKTTLLKTLFPNYRYINLEFPDELSLVQEDPRGVIDANLNRGIIFDEAQRYPELFSYIQGYVDRNPQKGKFILSGSQNFLLANKVSQSLAGRAAIIELFPLTYSEYCSHPQSEKNISLWRWLYCGTYPRPYQEHLDTKLWYKSYIQTYLERDLRFLAKVQDLAQFQRFLQFCAARHGQILNLTQLAQDAGITRVTAQNWLSILQASYIVYLLTPYYENFNKRLIKSPKLYFYDPAIVCQLLGIDSAEHLEIHSMRGAIFEGYIISELLKQPHNRGEMTHIFYWRDSHGLELDCLIEQLGKIEAIEIKATMTLRPDLFSGLKKFDLLARSKIQQLKLVYAGDANENIGGIKILSWREL